MDKDYLDLEPIVDLYDYEIEIVNDLTQKLYNKFGHRMLSAEQIKEFENEVKGRFLDNGFIAELNAVEYLLDLIDDKVPPRPIEIVVMSRAKVDDGFDYERKAWEVKQSRKKGGK